MPSTRFRLQVDSYLKSENQNRTTVRQHQLMICCAANEHWVVGTCSRQLQDAMRSDDCGKLDIAILDQHRLNAQLEMVMCSGIRMRTR